MVALMLIQLAVTIIVGIYFFRQLKNQSITEGPRTNGESRDMHRLGNMRMISLTKPLSETVRPASLEEIVGQQNAVKAMKAILCGPNPQHVLIYGPPGVGKTCVARLVLEQAKLSAGTPFRPDAPFIEIDATCVRFDERAIADPLIGSVHDPIYQGAGNLGINGVPQPKEGAVTRAHGGVLFLDEIGEMHPIQMNKLLKVLEDRKVRFESAYYDPYDNKTPKHIHDIFKNGLPADFRLIGATTRSPEEIVPALRSRCMEVFFDPLDTADLYQIALTAGKRAGYELDDEDARLIGRSSRSGRDAVNIVQMASGLARQAQRNHILKADVEWVIECGRYPQRPDPIRLRPPQVGIVHALAVFGSNQGVVLELEATARSGNGNVKVTGIIDTEEIGQSGHKLTRSSTARAASQTVITALGEEAGKYDIHLNFPGGAPVDGPSAGVAMAVAIHSAIHGVCVRGDAAFTGEVSVQGRVLPVGGVSEKIQAAIKAGLKTVVIPRENIKSTYESLPIQVLAVSELSQAISIALAKPAATIPLPAATVKEYDNKPAAASAR
ncbi:MAG: ATP-dependent protease LonB [Clostridia bacterium]|nr:ATP-dependent protease LonB [Clostridia bacterium]